MDPLAAALAANAITITKKGETTALYTPTEKGALFHEAPEPYVLAGGGRNSGKLLRLNTPLPTPSGFTTMGAVVVGDHLLDEQGHTTHVVWKSAEHIDPTGTYRVTFSDGTQVVAGGQHEWWTFTKAERKALGRRSETFRAKRRLQRGQQRKLCLQGLNTKPTPAGGIRTTLQIAASLRYRREANHAVPVSTPWVLPHRDLPINPYVFGAWLGDGSRGCGHITGLDREIFAEIALTGFEVRHLSRAKTQSVLGLAPKLRALGVLHDKFVPHDYLWASVDQRLALLQGLMDTDGYVSPQGHVEFCNTNQRLAEAVLHLTRSLGIKATLNTGRATLYGKDCGPKYRVIWTSTVPVFRLPRKVACVPQRVSVRQQFRCIESIERIADELMQCVEVNSPSHLYLCTEAGIPTHNSHALRWDAHIRNLIIPQHRALLLRRTFPQLRGSHFAKVAVEGKLLGCAKDFNQSKYFLEYPNGSLLQFGHCESDAAILDYLSQEWDWIGFDELTTFTFDQFIRISASARTTINTNRQAYVRAATNPIGEGASWVKRYFLDKNVSEDDNPDYRPSEWRYIEMNLHDNPHANRAEYERKLLMLPNESLRRAYLYGEWLVEGQFFAEWRERKQQPTLDGDVRAVSWHVIPEMPTINSIPVHRVPWIRITRVVDWGFSELEPGYVAWIANLPNGTALVFKEWTFTGRIPEDVAKVIIAKSEGLTVDRTIGDPMMWREREGESIARRMAKCGLSMYEANNERENGWVLMHSWLMSTTDDGTGPQPRLQFLAAQGDRDLGAPYAIRTLPSLQTDPKRPRDLTQTTGVEDHAADALRYWSSNFPAPSREPIATLNRFPKEVVKAVFAYDGEHDVLGSESVGR